MLGKNLIRGGYKNSTQSKIHSLLRRNCLSIVWIVIAAVLFLSCKEVFASEGNTCPTHTPEQSYLVGKAYYKGLPHNLGYTLAAITIQESFVGRYVVRVNPDGSNESYGISHIELKTAMYLEGVDNVWEARHTIARNLMMDDDYALELALRKLRTYKGTDYMAMWSRYNGRGEAAKKYAVMIAGHIKMLKRCYPFEGVDFITSNYK